MKKKTNFEAYKTARDAQNAFNVLCNNNNCDSCKFQSGLSSCILEWIYSEQEKSIKECLIDTLSQFDTHEDSKNVELKDEMRNLINKL